MSKRVETHNTNPDPPIEVWADFSDGEAIGKFSLTYVTLSNN